MFSLLFFLLAQCFCGTQVLWKSCSNCVLQILLLHAYAASVGIRATLGSYFLPWHKEKHVGEDLLPQMSCMNAMCNQKHSFNEQRSGLMRFKSSSPPQPLEIDLKIAIQVHVMWRKSRILILRRITAILKWMMNTLKEFVQ